MASTGVGVAGRVGFYCAHIEGYLVMSVGASMELASGMHRDADGRHRHAQPWNLARMGTSRHVQLAALGLSLAQPVSATAQVAQLNRDGARHHIDRMLARIHNWGAAGRRFGNLLSRKVINSDVGACREDFMDCADLRGGKVCHALGGCSQSCRRRAERPSASPRRMPSDYGRCECMARAQRYGCSDGLVHAAC